MGFWDNLFGKSEKDVSEQPEERLHNDARRLASLLVMEIKLYNEEKVYDGIQNGDIYQRLKKEIDRSRKVYESRVSATVAAKYDYFYDELVTHLAGGDASKLGVNAKRSEIKP
jgi:hypothetical protein